MSIENIPYLTTAFLSSMLVSIVIFRIGALRGWSKLKQLCIAWICSIVLVSAILLAHA